ncbi:sugar kinase [Anopheles sinensis]|uniref:Sugar kinase n=1 Tax=Anopheles sinensis TaxID=74873 RepID=A0A084VRI8_ANOSI|nr:sugar kinase [Anopheles sinensis]
MMMTLMRPKVRSLPISRSFVRSFNSLYGSRGARVLLFSSVALCIAGPTTLSTAFVSSRFFGNACQRLLSWLSACRTPVTYRVHLRMKVAGVESGEATSRCGHLEVDPLTHHHCSTPENKPPLQLPAEEGARARAICAQEEKVNVSLMASAGVGTGSVLVHPGAVFLPFVCDKKGANGVELAKGGREGCLKGGHRVLGNNVATLEVAGRRFRFSQRAQAPFRPRLQNNFHRLSLAAVDMCVRTFELVCSYVRVQLDRVIE